MRLDGYGLFVKDMAKMIRFYRDVLEFEIKEDENTDNIYLLKDGTLFLLYGRSDFERLTSKKYEYLKGVNAHSEMALYVDTYEEVDLLTVQLLCWSRPPSLGGKEPVLLPIRKGTSLRLVLGISHMKKRIYENKI